MIHAHIQSEVTSLATCFTLTRKDKQVLCFTDHDQDLQIAGLVYHSTSGFNHSAMSAHASLAVDHMEVEAVLSHELISQHELELGYYDHAELEVFRVNYRDLAAGRLFVKRGWLGEVRLQQGRCTAEIRGMSSFLHSASMLLVSRSCRAMLGDPRCGVELSRFSVEGAVEEALDHRRFVDTHRTEHDGWFTHGVLRFLSGKNAGQVADIEHYQAKRFELLVPMPFPIIEGDRYQVSAGCDKELSTCREKFSNVINFRGEPHVPGMDRLLQVVRR